MYTLEENYYWYADSLNSLTPNPHSTYQQAHTHPLSAASKFETNFYLFNSLIY